MFVKEWMTADPRTVSSSTSVMEAMQLLRKGGYRRLPVVDEGALVGLVTDRDLKEATPAVTNTSIYELNYSLSKLRVGDVMVKDVFSVSPEDPVERAALLMEENKVSGLPVVEGDKVVGIVTISDILATFVNVLGLLEGGTRVTLELPDAPGILAQVAEAGPPSNIIAVVTANMAGGKRELVLRVTGDAAAEFPERLKQRGIEVKDVQ